jgi:preprotein translocase subunit SecE
VSVNRDDKQLVPGTAGASAAVGASGVTVDGERLRRPAAPGARRIRPRQFVNEVVLELRKVVRPSKSELVNYSTVVLLAIAFVMAFVYGLDYVFATGANSLFK